MNSSLMEWLLGAFVLSWAMGAYNRLIRLRAKGLLAFSALEKTLDQQVMLMSASFLDDAFALGHETLIWRKLYASTQAVNTALKIVHSQPLSSEATLDLKIAIAQVESNWRLLLSVPPDLAGAVLPSSFQLQWEQLALQVERAKTDFNQSVLNFNEAKNQFPANVLARVFNFKTAQPL